MKPGLLALVGGLLLAAPAVARDDTPDEALKKKTGGMIAACCTKKGVDSAGQEWCLETDFTCCGDHSRQCQDDTCMGFDPSNSQIEWCREQCRKAEKKCQGVSRGNPSPLLATSFDPSTGHRPPRQLGSGQQRVNGGELYRIDEQGLLHLGERARTRVKGDTLVIYADEASTGGQTLKCGCEEANCRSNCVISGSRSSPTCGGSCVGDPDAPEECPGKQRPGVCNRARCLLKSCQWAKGGAGGGIVPVVDRSDEWARPPAARPGPAVPLGSELGTVRKQPNASGCPSTPPPGQTETTPTPRAGLDWVTGHWETKPSGCKWIKGHWERAR